MNDFRRSENPTKPTTSDMTVAEIIIKAVTGHDMKMYELRHGADYGVDGFEATQLERVEEALAAIEAHYAAIRKADMEYIAQNHGVKLGILIEQRLNNTEEQV